MRSLERVCGLFVNTTGTHPTTNLPLTFKVLIIGYLLAFVVIYYTSYCAIKYDRLEWK